MMPENKNHIFHTLLLTPIFINTWRILSRGAKGYHIFEVVTPFMDDGRESNNTRWNEMRPSLPPCLRFNEEWASKMITEETRVICILEF